VNALWLTLLLGPVFLSIEMTTTKDSSLYYLIREPRSPSPQSPLVILLHGVGSNEKDLFALADQIPDDFWVVSLRAPYTVGPDRYAWYQVDFSTGRPVIDQDQAEQSRKKILDFIVQLKSAISFDEGKLYLAGFSQGGIMSYSVGLSQPEMFRGISIFSGRLLEEVKPAIATPDRLRSLQVLITHGTEDSVLSVAYAREAFAFLERTVLHPVFKEYPTGHTLNHFMIRDWIKWLHPSG
jgi:phospholipase/carboxylesterase